VGENYQISFAEYKTQFTEDAGGAMLDKDAIAAVKGVKVRRLGLGSLMVLDCTVELLRAGLLSLPFRALAGAQCPLLAGGNSLHLPRKLLPTSTS